MRGRTGGAAVRRYVRWGAALLATVILRTGPSSVAAQQQAIRSEAAVARAPLVVAVGPIGLTVSDMEKSLDFYTRVLHFTLVADTEVAGDGYEHLQGLFGLRMRVVRLRLGEESLELSEYLAPAGRPGPVGARSNDRWFQHVAIIVRDMAQAYRWLRENRVQHASSGPQRLPDWNPNAGGIEAFYFRDPDGHPLEILAFPAGKGDPKWHRPSDSLFLGIDHTAIVVDNTELSLAFYRDVLGFRVVGESENSGTEQEHLNNVFGARLRIMGLRAADGPGIEFLEYLAPRDGRPYPADERVNDLVHWQTGITVRTTSDAYRALLSAGARLVSSGIVSLPGRELGFGQGFLVRDPDGHVLRLTER